MDIGPFSSAPQVTRMHHMSTTSVLHMSEAGPRARARRRIRALAAAANTAAAASQNPTRPSGGRAWLNGTELGVRDDRYAHLTRAHD
jgi:hypothetical protein